MYAHRDNTASDQRLWQLFCNITAPFWLKTKAQQHTVHLYLNSITKNEYKARRITLSYKSRLQTHDSRHKKANENQLCLPLNAEDT